VLRALDDAAVRGHQVLLAELLGFDLLSRGRTTSKIASATNHSEHTIDRYQRQFDLVLHLMHCYPEVPNNDLWRLSGLSRKAWEIYREVARELLGRPASPPRRSALEARDQAALKGGSWAGSDPSGFVAGCIGHSIEHAAERTGHHPLSAVQLRKVFAAKWIWLPFSGVQVFCTSFSRTAWRCPRGGPRQGSR